MQINRVGEFGLIARLRKRIKTGPAVVKGIGDDCAVLEFNKNRYQLFTCDTLVEGVDFIRAEKPYRIGRKAIAVSVSDIAACAGIPQYCLVALAVPQRTTVNFIDELLRGILSIARKYKIDLAGGDLSRSGHLVINVSMLGSVEKKNLVLRNGAETGDIIFVTGSLGGSIKGKHLNFTPRVKEARFLAKNFKVNAMIDISDGLAQDLGHILKESNKGAVIYEQLIPLAQEAENLNDALYKGEDFELLFTLPRKEAKKLMKKNIKIFRVVGEITERRCGLMLLDRMGRAHQIRPKGFRHF